MNDQDVGVHVEQAKREAADACREVERRMTHTLEAAHGAGGKLRAAKEAVGHGNWLPWLREEGISSRTAERYIRLHEGYPEIRQLGEFAGIVEAVNALPSPRRSPERAEEGADATAGAEPPEPSPNEPPEPEPSLDVRPAQEVLPPEEPAEGPSTRMDKLREDNAMLEASLDQARIDIAKAERDAEIQKERAEAAEAVSKNAASAGSKVVSSEARADSLRGELVRTQQEANDLRRELSSFKRRLTRIRRTLEKVRNYDPIVQEAIEPVLTEFWGERAEDG